MRLRKRVFDLFWVILGLAVIWPLFVLVALLIKLGDRGPVSFRQQRIGYKGQPFHIRKFRTMVLNAEQLGTPLTVGQRDPRITPIGYWLRRFKLDELPQLLNVLAGEMSLVGPRPEVPRYVALYTPEQRLVLGLVPGITDPASIEYRHESAMLAAVPDPEQTYVKEIMPVKIRINLEYATTSTLSSDFAVIVKTLSCAFR